MAKAILLLIVATPICAALATTIGVLSVDVLLSGEPFGAGDVAMALVFGLGSVLVVALGLSITFRHREQWAHRAIGVVLALGTVVGVGGGFVFGWGIVQEKTLSLAARVLDACQTARRDGRALPECEERAVECIHEARRNPAPAARGLGAPPEDPGRPVDPEARAIDDCLRH